MNLQMKMAVFIKEYTRKVLVFEVEYHLRYYPCNKGSFSGPGDV